MQSKTFIFYSFLNVEMQQRIFLLLFCNMSIGGVMHLLALILFELLGNRIVEIRY